MNNQRYMQRGVSAPRYSVTILLTLRARNLMIEEFPLSRKHIRWYAKRMWRFHAQVCALEGIGRFVLGLPEDVQIVLLTPIHRGPAKFSETNVQPSEEYCNACGEYIDAYVNVIKEASAIWSVPVIDMYSLCGLLPSRPEHSIYVPGGNDFLHPNQEGHRRMALCLYHQLKSIPSSF
jgi:hypothetical protein